MILKSRGILIALLAVLSHVSVAQRYIPVPEVNSQKEIVASSSASGTLRVLAIMVEFQTDNDRTTIGNGQFDSIYTRDWGTSILDPLPHDSAYFSAHLEFAKNYYSKVSRGALQLQYTVLPQVITLSKTMREYSPPIRSTDFTPMVSFYEESWKKADELHPGYDFSGYDVFCIFHAGVGRDVSLPGSLSNERDLPSVYFNLESFRKYKGAGYNGVPVSGGNFTIKNSMILPQTQNREIESFGNSFLVEITINGLLVSSIASYLGLPDLFDTKTGLSAIGRFGLMDGQSIFAYNGVFPPNPSAWERVQLGWDSAIPLNDSSFRNNVLHSIKAVSSASSSDTTIYKVSLSADEHYYIENRLKDSDANGITFTMWNNGSVYQRSFTKDTSWFNSFTVDSLEGVIIDVDDFDWALPGSGILVWHIDEKVIRENIAANQVNANKLRRGVDLEEADGIQDIGEQFTTIFGDVLVGEGDELDLWYSTNESDLYKNEFSDITRPDTRSNSGANSLIKLYDFSGIAKNAHFRIGSTDQSITPVKAVKNFPVNMLTMRYFDVNGQPANIQEYDTVVIASIASTNYTINKGSRKAVYYSDGNELIVITVDDTTVIQTVIGTNSRTENRYNPGFTISADPSIMANIIYIGSNTGVVRSFTMDKNGAITLLQDYTSPGAVIKKIFPYPMSTFYVAQSGSQFQVFASSTEIYLSDQDISSLFVSNFPDGTVEIYLLTVANELIVLNRNNLISMSELKSKFVVGPKSGFGVSDQATDVIIFSAEGMSLKAYNLFNIASANFPIQLSSEIISNISFARNLSGKGTVFFVTKDGLLHGISLNSGSELKGFPLPFANGDSALIMLRYNFDKIALIAYSDNGSYAEWNLTGIAEQIVWSENQFGSSTYEVVTLSEKNLSATELLDKSKTYNYPNPVSEGSTQIRFFTSVDANITVKIFDAAGELADELTSNAVGGFDQELSWNVSDIQSGIYFARIEAVSASGKKDHKIIKIAVVK